MRFYGQKHCFFLFFFFVFLPFRPILLFLTKQSGPIALSGNVAHNAQSGMILPIQATRT